MDLDRDFNIELDLSNLHKVINPTYFPYLKDKSRYSIFYGGAGSGKSVFIAQKLLLRILIGLQTGKKHKFLCLRKTMPAARKSVYALLRALSGDDKKMGGWNITDLYTLNKTEMLFEFKNGSEIICGGLDDPEKLKSIHGITGMWLEEANEMTKADFRQIDLRLRGQTDSYKQILISFNPITKLMWIYDEFFEKKKDDCSILQTTYKDNLFLDKKYVKMLENLKEEDPQSYKIYTLGEWGVLENVIFTNFDIIKEFPPDEKFEDICYGLDYGYNAATCLTFNGMRDEEYYIKEMLYEHKLTHTDVINALGALIPLKYRSRRFIYVDNAEPELIRELIHSGFKAKPANKSVRDGIDFCRRVKLYLDDESSNLIKEIHGYKYKEDANGNVVDDPVKFNDHAMDSMRYGLFTHFGKVRPKASIVIV